MSYNLRKRSSDANRSYVTKRTRFFEAQDDDKEWRERGKNKSSDGSSESDDSSDDDSTSSDDSSNSYSDSTNTSSTESASDDSSSSDDSDDSDDSEEYYHWDKDPLIDAVTERLSRKLANLNIPKDSLREAVENSIDKASGDIFEGLCSNKPADTRWKAGLNEETVAELEPQLTSMRKEMAEEKPTMEKILRTKIPKKEKKKAIRLFDVLQNVEPYTDEYLSCEDQIRDILELEKDYKGVDIDKLEEDEKRLSEA